MRKSDTLDALKGLAIISVVVAFTYTLVQRHGDPASTTPQQELAAAARARQDKQAPAVADGQGADGRADQAADENEVMDVSAALDQARKEVDAANRHNQRNQAAIRNR